MPITTRMAIIRLSSDHLNTLNVGADGGALL